MKFRKPYDPCPRFGCHCTSAVIDGLGTECVVRGEFKNICDINHICQKIMEDGVSPVPMTVKQSPRQAQFGDFSTGGDFTDLQNKQLAGERYFESLPNDVRNRFGSSSQFFSSLDDPNIITYLVEAGVLPAPITPKKGAKAKTLVPPESEPTPAPPAPQA